MIAFANLISPRIIWRPGSDGWLWARAPGSRGGTSLEQDRTVRAHLFPRAAGGRAHQPGTRLGSESVLSWERGSLRACPLRPLRKSPSGTVPLWLCLAPEALVPTSARMPGLSQSFPEQGEPKWTGVCSLPTNVSARSLPAPALIPE